MIMDLMGTGNRIASAFDKLDSENLCASNALRFVVVLTSALFQTREQIASPSTNEFSQLLQSNTLVMLMGVLNIN